MTTLEEFNEHDWKRGDDHLPEHLVSYHRNSDVFICTKCGQVALAVVGTKPAIEHNGYQRNCKEEMIARVMSE